MDVTMGKGPVGALSILFNPDALVTMDEEGNHETGSLLPKALPVAMVLGHECSPALAWGCEAANTMTNEVTGYSHHDDAMASVGEMAAEGPLEGLLLTLEDPLVSPNG